MSSFGIKRNYEEKVERKTTRELQRRKKQTQIPPFYGDFNPDSYLEWEKEMDLVFCCHNYTAEKQVSVAVTGFYGFALDWWNQISNSRRLTGEQKVSSWFELKFIMKKRFVSRSYGQFDLGRMHSPSNSARARPRTAREESRTSYSRDAPRSSQKLVAQLDLQIQQFQNCLSIEIHQECKAAVQTQQKRPIPGPVSVVDEISCYQVEPAREKEKIEQKPAASCKEDSLSDQLMQEQNKSALKDHVCVLTKAEQGVLDGSSKSQDLALTTMVEEGDIIESFSCELLTKPLVGIKLSLMEYLRYVEELQHYVFKPGGSPCVHRSTDSTMVQRERKKLRLDSPFIHKELDLRTNPFKGGGNGATWISLKLCLWKPMHVPERKGVTTRPNGPIGELIGLIHEVLDREKAMGFYAAFIKYVSSMDKHGQLVYNLLDQEMDETKLDGYKMEWKNSHDLEIDFSNRYCQEMAWKWKMKNQSWKWIIRSIFTIQMSIKSNLVGIKLIWNEPNEDLVEKGPYRPMKIKDRPPWPIFCLFTFYNIRGLYF